MVYHGTTQNRARRICREGFLPKKPSRRVWFAESYGYALGRARTQAKRAKDHPAVLTCELTNECRIGWAPSLSSAFTRKPGRRFSVVFGHAHRRCARKHGYARHRTLPAVNRLERLPAEAGTLAGMG